jgi:dihydrolipoamide dehydrogenase
METKVPGVFAIGDILGPRHIMLAHVASHEGMVAAENALGGRAVMDYSAVPGAIFTMPEIGNVGITEAQAREQGIDYTCAAVNFRTLGKAQAMGEIAGEARIVAEKATGRVLGMHIIGPHATDLIAEGTLAVNKGLSVRDLAHTIHAHPTLSEIIFETALSAVQ